MDSSNSKNCCFDLMANIEPKTFHVVQIISNMVAGSKDKSIQEVLKTIDKIAFNPDELAYWTTAVETTAKHMCKDVDGKIKFVYCPVEKSMRFFCKDSKSRNCLVKSIEIHLSLMPETLQGFFSVFKYNLKKAKFEP